MDFEQGNLRWHRSCESDAWPFCANPVLFEARRAVGQAVRTAFDFLPGDAVASGVLKYIAVAKAIEGELHDRVLPELVAEARADGVDWDAIGETLGIGDAAARQRFGTKPAPDRKDLPSMEDQVVKLSNQLLAGLSADSIDWAELREELGDTSPRGRMRHAVSLMRGAENEYKTAEGELALPLAERDDERFLGALSAANQKIMTLMMTIAADPAQWAASPDWGQQPDNPDAAHYHAPGAYIFYAMRLVMLAGNYNAKALSPGLAFDARVPLFRTARQILETSMMVMMRRDASSVVSAAIRDD
jgi:hypothetical protein